MPNPLLDYGDPEHPLLRGGAAALPLAFDPETGVHALDRGDPVMRRILEERQRSVDMGLWDPVAGKMTLPGMANLGMGYVLSTSDVKAPGGVPGIRAYHGSPHSFERFSSDYIGSGTGESQFSRGLHFANEADAKVYRDTLAPGGHLYEVNIKADPEHFLDWDKPLSEQSPYVQKALKDAGITKGALDADPTGADLHTMLRHGVGMVDKEGGLFYPGGKAKRDDAQTVQMLRDAGIPGMRHHGDSYVVYDDSLIDILRKYGIAGLGIGAGALGGNALNEGNDNAQ